MFTKIFTSSLLFLIAIGGFFVNFEVKKESDIQIAWISLEYMTSVYASGTTAPPPVDQWTEVKKMYNNIAAGLNIALGIVTVIVSPAIMLAGWLMSPDWTSGDLFGLRWVMYKLWVTISNITYFIYAILLIFIAFAAIFGSNTYRYQSMLPKLALGILMVPFTWLFIQQTISLSSYITASVISIPEEALRGVMDQTSKTWWNTPSIPKDIIIDENATVDSKTLPKVDCTKEATKCISPEVMLKNSSWMYGHMLIYAYGVFKLGDVKEIKTGGDVVYSIAKLLHDGFIAVIMLVVFGILTMALIFMLLFRAVMLWVYTIFSPFMTLDIVMWWMVEKLNKDFSIKEFIWLAFVPALVWLALSFWLVIIAAVQNPIKPSWEWIKCDAAMLKPGGPWCTLAYLMGNPENKIVRKTEETKDKKYLTINEVVVWWVTFTFKGAIWWATDLGAQAQAVSETTSIISATGGVFGTIIVDIIALLFIWVAFMAAKGVNRVVGIAAKPFEEMGTQIGKLWMSLPKYMPLPVPGWSVAGMQRATDLAVQIPQKEAEKRFNESSLWQNLGAWEQASAGDMQQVKQKLANIKNDDAVLRRWDTVSREAIQKLVSNGAKYDKSWAYKEFMDAVREKYKTSSEIESYLISWWMDKEIAQKLAIKIADGHTDRKIHGETDRLWKEAGKNGGTNSGTNSTTTTNNTFNITDNGGWKFSLKSSEFELSPRSAKEISDELLKKPEKLINVPETEIRKQLEEMKRDWMTEDMIKWVLKAVNDVRTGTNPPKGTSTSNWGWATP
jgi:hypothetical protein